MRPLLVGEAPCPAGNTEPFDGPSGRRLALILGVGHAELLATTDRLNLLDSWPGACGKGSAFPAAEARAAAAVALALAPHRTLLLAGRRVAAAFGLRALPYLRWAVLGRRRVAVLPHPSGVNRWLNDPANRAATRDFVLAAVYGEALTRVRLHPSAPRRHPLPEEEAMTTPAPLTVTSGRTGILYHRPTCKRAKDPVGTSDTYLNGKPASCCKPSMPERAAAAQAAHPAEPIPAKARPRTASTDRLERVRLAKAEARALKAWREAGERARRPETPNLDSIDAGERVPGKVRSIRPSRAQVRYLRNGVAPARTRPWTLGYVASQCTARVVEGKARLTVAELTEVLAGLGVEDPHAPGWSAELPNGVTISCEAAEPARAARAS